MKKILLLLFTISSITYGQAKKITYKAVLHNPKQSSSELVVTNMENAKWMKFNLLFNKKTSSIEVEYFGMLSSELIRKQKKSRLTEILIGFSNPFFQDINKNSLMSRLIDYEAYQVDHVYKMKDWVVTEERKEILGYECVKAVRKDFNKRAGKYIHSVAWFTPKIDKPFGPIGFGGLPGVILELHKGDLSSFYAEKIEEVTGKPLNIPDGKKVSIEESIRLSRLARGQ